VRVADNEQHARVRWLGLTGAAVQLGMATMIATVASQRGTFPAPPEAIPRGLALLLLLALPAVVGALGAVSADRGLMGAASILAAAASVIAFSGITLMFLAPALLLAVAAGSGTDVARPMRRAWTNLLILTVGGGIVTLAVLRFGIFTLPLIVVGVLSLGLIGGRRRPTMGGGAVLLVIVLTGVAAGGALLGLTETRCWEAYRTPSGIEYRTVAETSTHMVTDADAFAAGCDGGSLTARGAGIAAILGLGALGVALWRASSP